MIITAGAVDVNTIMRELMIGIEIHTLLTPPYLTRILHQKQP